MWALHRTHTVLGFVLHRRVALRGQTSTRNKHPPIMHCPLLSESALYETGGWSTWRVSRDDYSGLPSFSVLWIKRNKPNFCIVLFNSSILVLRRSLTIQPPLTWYALCSPGWHGTCAKYVPSCLLSDIKKK